jgi:predicted amidohydrolase YtcJ
VTSQRIAITHTVVVDVHTGSVRDDQTVLIEGARIVAIAPSGVETLLPRARVIDAAGTNLIPGLWDAHVHLSYMGACALPVLVANGITAVRDAGARLDEIRSWRSQIARGALVGPFIETAGPDIDSGDWLRHAFEIAPRDHR